MLLSADSAPQIYANINMNNCRNPTLFQFGATYDTCLEIFPLPSTLGNYNNERKKREKKDWETGMKSSRRRRKGRKEPEGKIKRKSGKEKNRREGEGLGRKKERKEGNYIRPSFSPSLV